MTSKLIGGSVLLLLIALTGLLIFQVQEHEIQPTSACGATSLFALLQTSYGHRIIYEQVADLFPKSERGVCDMAMLQSVAAHYRVRLTGYAMTVSDLKRRRVLGILHVDCNHFIALIGYTDSGVTVADPVGPGRYYLSNWSYGYLQRRWDGVILVKENNDARDIIVGH